MPVHNLAAHLQPVTQTVSMAWVAASCMEHAQLEKQTQQDVLPQLAEQTPLMEQTQLLEQTRLIAQSGHPATPQSPRCRLSTAF